MKFSTFGAASALLLGLALPLTCLAQQVNAGYDLFQTDASSTQFPGLGNLMGVPLGTFDFGSGNVRTGDADTIIQRMGAAAAGVGGTASVNIQMAALQLETTAPVSFMGSPVENFFVTLDPSQASTGAMNITFASANGGTFTSSLDLFFDIRAGSLNGPIIGGVQNVMLQNSGEAWSTTAPPGAVLINGVDNLLNGVDTANDFWPGNNFSQGPPTGGLPMDLTDPATVPDSASSFGLLLLPAAIYLAALRYSVRLVQV